MEKSIDDHSELVAAKKRYKIVVSDLHLGKGRTEASGDSNSLEEFFYGDKLVEFIHYHSSGLFRDSEVELIINGDFLNFLQVDYRGHFLTVLTEDVCLEVLQSIVDGHRAVFKALGEFARMPDRYVTYVIGNHDQPMMWPACREYLDSVLGASVRYKNLVYFFDGVHIEHGHMQEAANRVDPRRFFLKKDLPAPILNLPFGSHFFIDLVLKIKHQYPFVDKIRPFSKMVRWALFNETRMCLNSLFKVTVYFIKAMTNVDVHRNWNFKTLVKIIFESAIFPDLTQSAKKILQDDRIKIVVFGHSHVYQYRQWANNKEYFNTGTWTEVTSLDVNSLGKMTKLTYVYFEYQDGVETPRARLKEWRGYHRIEEDVAL
jgi:UDP-2,3-diacylglucosamine pyrophosphatase LpxH